MVERLGEMRKGRRERIDKGSRERIIECTEANVTSLIPLDPILPEKCTVIVGFSCNVWTNKRKHWLSNLFNVVLLNLCSHLACSLCSHSSGISDCCCCRLVCSLCSHSSGVADLSLIFRNKQKPYTLTLSLQHTYTLSIDVCKTVEGMYMCSALTAFI